MVPIQVYHSDTNLHNREASGPYCFTRKQPQNRIQQPPKTPPLPSHSRSSSNDRRRRHVHPSPPSSLPPPPPLNHHRCRHHDRHHLHATIPDLPSPATVPCGGRPRRLSVPSVRLPGSDASKIRAFSSSNISLSLSIPNLFLPSIASNRSNAISWLSRHLVPFYLRAKIIALSVGTDPLNAKTDLSDCIIPGIRNVYIALHELGIRDIEVSTAFSFVSVMTCAFPPSGVEPAKGLIVKPLLQFLQETNSSFFVNIHPYHLFRMNKEIPVGFALFQENKFSFRDDLVTGVRYRNLFDTMVDAVVTAMTVAGHEGISVMVVETGWPSRGGGEVEANELYAEMYLRGFLRHLRSGVGTPLRKEGVKEVYVYELFDRQNSRVLTGVDSQQWGVLYPNLTNKYDVEFGSAGNGQFGGVGVVRLAFVLVLVAAVFL